MPGITHLPIDTYGFGFIVLIVGNMKVFERLFLLVIFSILFINVTFINADNSWIASYTDNIGSYKVDVAVAMVVDTKGNIYVTGNGYAQDTSSDIMTIKYDKSGNVKWIQKYSGLANLSDYASDITLDKSGNIYVSGTSYLSAYECDIVVIKYNSSGKVIWTTKYHKLEYGNNLCEAKKIIVDNLGNIYVAGIISSSGTTHDYLTIKYNSFGFEEWVQTYNGTGNDDDQVVGMVKDTANNIYVTGYSIGKNTGCDIATIKYDNQGNQKWVSRYNSNPNVLNVEDVATGIDIDNQANLYITGHDKTYLGKDFLTLKIDSSGKVKWAAKYQGNGGGDDIATAIAVDDIGNSYITGYAYNLWSNYDYTTIKYNTSGEMLWTRIYNGTGNYQDFANSIALDNQGGVYITGKSYSGTKSYGSDSLFNIVTQKYSINGDSIWTARYSANRSNNGILVKTDMKDNVYVLGYINPTNAISSYVLIKYAQRRY
jgi:hypothetical protein